MEDVSTREKATTGLPVFAGTVLLIVGTLNVIWPRRHHQR